MFYNKYKPHGFFLILLLLLLREKKIQWWCDKKLEKKIKITILMLV